jgi:hypothetical protein
MNIGDIVIVTESFGGGLRYLGTVGVVKRVVYVREMNIVYNLEVYVDDRVYICNAVPATGLIKALL